MRTPLTGPAGYALRHVPRRPFFGRGGTKRRHAGVRQIRRGGYETSLAASVRVKRVRLEADCLGSARCEHIERGVERRRRSAVRLRLDRVGPPRTDEFRSNEELQVECWKAVGNLFCRLSLIADELEHVTIRRIHLRPAYDFPRPGASSRRLSTVGAVRFIRGGGTLEERQLPPSAAARTSSSARSEL